MQARGAAALLVAFALLRGLVVAAVIPPLQGVDEPAHFDYAQRLAESRALPLLGRDRLEFSPEVREAARQLLGGIAFHPERKPPLLTTVALPDPRLPASRFTDGQGPAATYPPLYYAAAALSYRVIPESPLFARIRAARLVSIVLGALAALLVLFGAHRLLGDWRAALAVAAIYSLQAQLAFLFAVVNNDAALFAATAGALFSIAALYRSPSSRGALAGLALAALAGALSKPTLLLHLPALGLLALVALGYLRPLSWLRAALALAPAAICGLAWTLWRGTPLSPATPRHISLANYLGDYVLASRHVRFVWHDLYWMGWGWHDVWLWRPWYWLLAILLLAALLSAVFSWRHLSPLERGILSAGAMASALSLFALHATELAMLRRGGGSLLQGRYLLPLFPVHAAMLVVALRGAGRVFKLRLQAEWAGPVVLGAVLVASVARALARY